MGFDGMMDELFDGAFVDNTVKNVSDDLFNIYDSLTQSGFSESQAMSILLVLLENSL